MIPSRLIRHILPVDATLADVLHRMNEGIQGVLFLVDADSRVDGMFTDGDVRRALLAGAKLDEPAAPWANRTFASGKASASHEENLKLLTDRIRHLPILDEAGRLVDLITWAEIWRLPVMEPSLGGNELKYVSDCISSGWISSQGHYITRFQEAFQDYHDGLHSLCVSSGTTALHLALAAMDIGPGDEVIVPDLTFAATANVVIHCGATPVLADVNRETWTIDPAAIERLITPKTKAIIPVHLYGHPADMDPIMEIARKHNLRVIEDCAESLGAEYRGKKTGTIGDVGCFSFFANKIITTGEGGMVTTRDRELNDKMAVLRDHGMQKDRRYWHLYPGFNYRMTNLQAAIGLAQMEQLDRFLAQKDALAQGYDEQLRGIPGITLPPRAPWARSICWLYSILIDTEVAGLSMDALSEKLRADGIDTRPFFHPLHIQPPYVACSRGDYPVTDELAARGLSLPSANNLRPEDISRVGSSIRALLTK